MAPDQIGSASVKFETSCAAAVKDDFNKAVALLHSFWFPEATKMFEAIADKDPSCAMAHWGIAHEPVGQPFAGLKHAQVDRARQSDRSTRRRATGSPTPRERALIDAVASLYSSADPATQRDAHRRLRGRDGEGLARAIPTDIEVRIFYALAVSQSAVPTDKTYAKNVQAAGILEPLFKQMPTHPGARALHHSRLRRAAAGRAGRSSPRASTRRSRPAIPHALHMPSHTFTRVGSWKESIETNRSRPKPRARATAPARSCTRSTIRPTPICRSAQDKAAKAVLDHALGVVGGAEGDGRRRRRRRRVCDRRDSGALRARARRLGRSRGLAGAARRTRRTPKRSPTSRAPSARRAAATRRRPPPTSRGSRRCATSCSDEGRVLDRAGRHPAPRRARVADLRAGQQGRRPSRSSAPPPTPRTPPTSRPSRPVRSRPRASCSATCCSKPARPRTRSSRSRRR